MRGLFKRLGMETPKHLWGRPGLAWITSAELPDEAALERDMLADELALRKTQIKRVEAQLNAIAKADPRITLLRTIPGVGIRTAEAVVAWIDQPARFKSSKAVASYFGLVPCEDSSAGIRHLGHITKQGPSLVRRLIAEAAWQAIRRSPTVRAYFERVAQGDPDRRKKAVVATAHYLLRCMHAMLRETTTWKEQMA
jgi:transposase